MNTFLNSGIAAKPVRPVRILQFGEGNFLRAFVDYFFQTINDETDFNGGIVVIKPIPGGSLSKFKKQDCLYTVRLCGMENGDAREVIKQINVINDIIDPYVNFEEYMAYSTSPLLKVIVSNTTEAGIVYSDSDQQTMTPPSSFPGKLTQFLYNRYCHFAGDPEKGLTILSCELIDDNGRKLREIVLKLADRWGLEKEFSEWINASCVFASTLVDRIVSGYPHNVCEKYFEQFGYRDELLVSGELFGLWVIEAPESVRKSLNMDLPSLPIIFTDNHKPYKKRKVRILNGAHTAFTAAAALSGMTYVNESLKDPVISDFLNMALFKEIIPSLGPDVEAPEVFAKDVLDRFRNPFVDHALLDICLNSVSKWETRCMPSLLEYYDAEKTLPPCLTFSLAAIMAFYSKVSKNENGGYFRIIGDKKCKISETAKILDFFIASSNLSRENLVINFFKEGFISSKPAEIPGFVKEVAHFMESIENNGCYETMKAIAGSYTK